MKTSSKLQRHENWDATDHEYLRSKGYTDADILAIWDRDAASGKPAQKHLVKAPDLLRYARN